MAGPRLVHEVIFGQINGLAYRLDGRDILTRYGFKIYFCEFKIIDAVPVNFTRPDPSCQWNVARQRLIPVKGNIHFICFKAHHKFLTDADLYIRQFIQINFGCGHLLLALPPRTAHFIFDIGNIIAAIITIKNPPPPEIAVIHPLNGSNRHCFAIFRSDKKWRARRIGKLNPAIWKYRKMMLNPRHQHLVSQMI